jgi:hypothetical protein
LRGRNTGEVEIGGAEGDKGDPEKKDDESVDRTAFCRESGAE